VENIAIKFLKPARKKKTHTHTHCVTMGTATANITIKEQDKSNKETIHDNTNTHSAPSSPPL
jgi:hypothetical protein